MHHSTFIGHLASIYNPTTYVELGLYHGETITKVQPFAKKLYGIDIKPNEHLESLRRFSNIDINYILNDDVVTNRDLAIMLGNVIVFLDIDTICDSIFKKRVQKEYYNYNVLFQLSKYEKLPELLINDDIYQDKMFDHCYLRKVYCQNSLLRIFGNYPNTL